MKKLADFIDRFLFFFVRLDENIGIDPFHYNLKNTPYNRQCVENAKRAVDSIVHEIKKAG